MAARKLIAVKEFCTLHKVRYEFISELHRNDMIELVMVKKTGYIPHKYLSDLEKMVRLYNDLHINIEGIQTILHLLSRLEDKETELKNLRNQLEFYSSLK